MMHEVVTDKEVYRNALKRVAADLIEIDKMVADGKLSSTAAKTLINAMFDESVAWQVVRYNK